MRKIENLGIRYGEKTLFQDLTYTFPDVGVVRVAGRSGSGKTTLLRILLGLEKEYDGRTKGFGKECAAVFQEHRLFPALSALQNVTEPNVDRVTEEDKKRASLLLAALGFHAEEMHKKPFALSGGMKQRVNIARGLFSDRPVLILDEPIKELDPALAATVCEMIRQEAKKRLVILVSHNQEDAMAFSENVIALDD